LLLGADLVDHDDLRHVVLDRLDHHRVLKRRRGDLHPPRAAYARVRDVAVPGDLVRGVHDDHALSHLIRQDARDLSQERRLPNARATEEQDAPASLDYIADDLHRAVDGPSDAQREANDLAGAVAKRADAVKGPLDARAVVPSELADAGDHEGDVLGGHLPL